MKKIRLYVCLAMSLLIFSAFLLRHLGYARQPVPNCPFPESGTWYCEELGITIFQDRGLCTIVDGDDTINCSLSREYGSCEIFIHCYERNNLNYRFEHLFFSGDFVNIEADSFYVKCHKSKNLYAFHKVTEAK